MTHELKTHPEYFQAVWTGLKTFEFRKDDRTPRFWNQDQVCLREWNPESETYTGREIVASISYVARGAFGIPDGYCVFSLHRLRLYPRAGAMEDIARRKG